MAKMNMHNITIIVLSILALAFAVFAGLFLYLGGQRTHTDDQRKKYKLTAYIFLGLLVVDGGVLAYKLMHKA